MGVFRRAGPYVSPWLHLHCGFFFCNLSTKKENHD